MLCVCITSCIKDGNFELPNLSITEPAIVVNSSISKIKTALQQAFNTNHKAIYTFPIHSDAPTYVTGYVISSDATGNFYKKLIVQDNYEAPTEGIELLVNASSLASRYEIGRKIYIKLDGLSVSYDDGESDVDPTNLTVGKYRLGYLYEGSIQNIPSTRIKDHIIKSAIVKEIKPMVTDISSITEAQIHTFIRLEDAQFDKTQLGKSFSGEPNDEYDGFRYLFDCKTAQTIKLQTSTFSSFKSTIIPSKKGSIDAVLTKDYTSEFFVLTINTPSDISFTDNNRCDPVFLECGPMTQSNANIIFSEDFENIKNNSNLLEAGWNNINSNGNSTVFKSKSSGGNRFMELSAYNTGESPLEVWLITPAINLDSTTSEQLSFDTNTGYDNGKVVNVYVATDFTGNIRTATWTLLDVALSEGPSTGYGSRFTSSGTVNIDCLQGNVNVAFRYRGADGGVTTTFRIDNFKITKK